MPDGCPDITRPKGHYRNASADIEQIIPRIDGRAELVLLRKFRRERKDIVLAPLQAGAVERPHLIRQGSGVGKRGIQPVPLQRHAFDLHILLRGIAEGGREQRQARKVVIHFKRQFLVKARRRAVTCNLNALAQPAQLP